MKFSLSLLRRHADLERDAEDVADALSAIGLEVETLTDPARDLKGFVAARVIAARAHPRADRLRVCDVDLGDGDAPTQVVCGAPNARDGMIGVFAPVGSVMPQDRSVLKRAEIRGVESRGMLCSERELKLSDEHDAVIELADHVVAGTPAAQALGLDDPVLDVNVTPNRPDALGVRGIARDLAALGFGDLKPLDIKPVEGTFDSPVAAFLDFPREDEPPCPMFAGRFLRGVVNRESPTWMRKALRDAGMNPISTLVDITNYVALVYGRPLHVFDASKLLGGRVGARRARDGEAFRALDGKDYRLSPDDVVIADAEKVRGLGGVIGGEDSACDDDTVDVFLESAFFEASAIAAAGRRHGILTEARRRFERGVDPLFVEVGIDIAARLILDLCGGEASRKTVAGTPPSRLISRRAALRPSRVAEIGGLDVPVAEQRRILSALGFNVADGEDGQLMCDIPSWRPDVAIEEDLIEEICRLRGLDRIPSTPLPRRRSASRSSPADAARRKESAARRRLASRGMREAVTWSFLSRRDAERFGGGGEELRIVNPISSELSHMRPSLLANLLSAASRATARGAREIAAFEIGSVYLGDEPDDQRPRVAGIRGGLVAGRSWRDGATRVADAYDAKADALAALDALGAPVAKLGVGGGGGGDDDVEPWFHPRRSARLTLGPTTRVATFGEIHPRLLLEMDLKPPIAAFEIFADAIPTRRGRRSEAVELPSLQPVRRDFAFVVDEATHAGALLRAVRSADKTLIVSATVFDVFRGESLPAGKKSVGIEATLQPRDKPLAESDLDAVADKIEKAALKEGATLRR